MKHAVIDMGSNSVRLMLAETEGGRILRSEKFLEMTRLASGVDGSGLLQERPMAETVEVVKRYRKLAEEAGAGLPRAYATSAVRDARNGEAFARRVLEETGVTVEIVPGALEAELGFLGVAATLEDSEETVLVIDIGGGSTECIVGSVQGIRYARSVNAGAVRMTGRHLASDPVRSEELERLREDVEATLAPVLEDLRGYSFSRVYGIGGTLTTAAAMVLEMREYDPQRVQHYPVTREALRELVGRLSPMPVSARRELPGLQPKRADVILAGFVIMEYLLTALGQGAFHASDADNLEGILFKYGLEPQAADR